MPPAAPLPSLPYGTIWDQIKSGKVVPFFGAGASLAGRAVGATFPPSGSELAEALATNCGFPSADTSERTNLSLVSSYFEQVACDRPALRDKLRGLFDPGTVSYPATPDIFRVFARMGVHLLAVTTNYDIFIEAAFRAEGRPYHLVVHSCDDPEKPNVVHWWKPGATEPETRPPSKLPLSEANLSDASIIYKMHGSVCPRNGHDSYVLSEEDYVRFLAEKKYIPDTLLNLMQDRRFLFLGYSLKDWNLRVLLSQLQLANAKRLKSKLRSWAVQRTVNDLDKKLWDKREVAVHELDLALFAGRLAASAGVNLNP